MAGEEERKLTEEERGFQLRGRNPFFSPYNRSGSEQWLYVSNSRVTWDDEPSRILPRMDFRDSDRVIVTLDNEYRPHCFENKPAVIYPDGRTEYYWHGVKVPDFVIEDPSKITIRHIQKEENTEVRRVMLDRFGLARFLKESGAKMIDEDEFGKLWRTEVPNDEPLVMVEVLNSTPEPDGSIKTYFLRVPPSTRTPHEGIAWTFGLERREYDPVFQS